ncbi:MAG: hypothetical protein ACI350_09115 [Prevotella sp.]
MKKSLLSVLMAIAAAVSCAAAVNPGSVTKFYSGLQALDRATDTNAANTAQQTMASCFMASEQSGINLSMDGLGEMSSNLYTMKLYNMIFSEKSLKINNFSITKTEIVEQPDQNNSMQNSGAQHYVSYVTKQYVKDGKTITYNDMVFTLISNGLIVEMQNSEVSGNVTPRPRPTEELNTEQLRARAAYCYSKGMYTESYDYYEKLVSRNPTDGDAAYRIALMTFWRKGCKSRYSRKEARRKADEYMQIALRYGNTEIRRKADNVTKNWENNNVYY